MRPQEYAKAIGSAVLAGLGVLYVALADNVLTPQEWVAVAQAAAAAFAVVWGLPNAPKQNTVSQKTVTVTSTDVPAPVAAAAVSVPVPEQVEVPAAEVVAPEHVADPLTGL